MRCTGHCCLRFYLPYVGAEAVAAAVLEHNIIDGAFIVDMILPIEGPLDEYNSQGLFTCRHFDGIDCTVYESRPKMCKDYPYGRPCTNSECTMENRGLAHANELVLLTLKEEKRDMMGEEKLKTGKADEETTSAPIPIILHCPECGERHIDKGRFSTHPHHTHSCQHCGLTWRPAVVATVGVQFLPGFKDDEADQ